MRSMSWRVFGCGRLLILKGRSARQMHGYQGTDKVYTIQHANGSAPEACALHRADETPHRSDPDPAASLALADPVIPGLAAAYRPRSATTQPDSSSLRWRALL